MWQRACALHQLACEIQLRDQLSDQLQSHVGGLKGIRPCATWTARVGAGAIAPSRDSELAFTTRTREGIEASSSTTTKKSRVKGAIGAIDICKSGKDSSNMTWHETKIQLDEARDMDSPCVRMSNRGTCIRRSGVIVYSLLWWTCWGNKHSRAHEGVRKRVEWNRGSYTVSRSQGFW